MLGCQNIPNNALKADPAKSLQAHTQLAAEYIKSADYDAASRELDTALGLNARDAYANMMMGVLLQNEGSPANIAKAERYFKMAIAVEPKNAQIRNNYGTYLYQTGRYNEALAQLEIAGSTLGYDQRYTALESKGRTYMKLGDLTHAESAFQQALNVNPASYIAMIELAEIKYLGNSIPAATQLYHQAVTLIGEKNLDSHALWIGIRIARANGNSLERQVLVNQLRALYPSSLEYQRYLQLQYSTEVVWK
ncbi:MULTISPECIES: type IV pilus biogenesis/stability protein PilW [unclassified Acinetobacter]|uniref:type IV pilus biogenesis/stability protein PilW n=1 Tax=unclassified Acinetobacter TaxID=196816 RepID=UPI002934806C|nr:MULTISPECIES: type IV pilus biogenesis/stability protein PilW [unclassified Acinetobacter]WOE30428.1 type IV pilus biogenesis/stability protein PilW [Acinetobacter sp. SAAs470]WOE38619.1 type IV pilus biogenesis/stability protein PilW [Acinetobacter sp. SAAs474]